MEVETLSNHLKYINLNGHTFNPEEKMHLKLALDTLSIQFPFDQLYFWGKIQGK